MKLLFFCLLFVCVSCTDRNNKLQTNVDLRDTISQEEMGTKQNEETNERDFPIYCNVYVDYNNDGEYEGAHITGIKGARIKFLDESIILYSKIEPSYLGIIYAV